MNAPRILVVEDNPTARKVFCLILQTEGYRVVEAGDARTALRRVREDAPALILQDLLLPDLNGLELLKQIRALPGGPELPIIALSGFPSIVDEAKVLPLGFDARLVKPVDQARLLAAVKALLPARALHLREPHGNGRRILLVDDDPVQAKLARLRLGQAGFDVTTASGATQALALAEQILPELVLSDVLMPDRDGFELCAELRARSRLADIPVVLMSAHFKDEHDRRLGARMGAHSLVLRTPDLGEVLSAVHSALSEGPAASPVDFPTSAHEARLVHRLDQLVQLNASLLRRASQQAAQLSIVGGVADALARSVDVDHAMHDVLAACLDAGGVSRGVLFREGAGGAFFPEQCVGFSEAEHGALAGTFTHPTLFALLQSGKPFGLSTLAEHLESSWFCAQWGVSSAVVVPILLESERGAALLLGSGTGELGEDELIVFGSAIGAYVAQALELSGAFRRLKASADADRILFASLSVDEIVRGLGGLALGSLGDWCVIDLVEEGPVLRPALALHADPARVALVQELERRYPPRPESSPRYGVLATHEAQAFSVSDAQRVASAEDPEHLRLLRELALKGQIVAPIMHDARLLGVLSVGRSSADRRPGTLDMALAEQLAVRAGLALENARLYAAAQLASRSKDEDDCPASSPRR